MTKTPRRRWGCITAVALLLLTAGTLTAWAYWPRCFSYANYERIQVGMNRERVAELLGSAGDLRVALITSIAFSPDGKRIAGASLGLKNDIAVWETSTGREICRCADKPGTDLGGRAWFNALVFSADGSTLFSGSGGRSIRVWDTATGKERARLPGHRGDICSLTLSADNTRLASASTDGTVLVWDLKSIGKR